MEDDIVECGLPDIGNVRNIVSGIATRTRRHEVDTKQVV
jgi:hypothetical protein